ncbi:MAG: D-alanyl-D-alanine carboxypeptidase family protein [Oscillospiraceae bacterium]|nr:D-alanyl-D-alanine carboxypeptidase family protein [Oscillospiraceae bacterium]
MKRFLSATVAAVMLLTLVACSNEVRDEEVVSGDVTTEAIVTEATTSEEEITTVPEEATDDVSDMNASDDEETAEDESENESTITVLFEVTEMEATTMYATDPLNVREGPDALYEALGQLAVGDAVTVTGETSNGWYQIDYNGTTAYVSGDYLREEEVITEDEYTEAVESDDEYYFQTDEDYLILVNKTHLLPDDYKIETDYVQGSYEMEKTAAYYCKLMIEAAAADGINLKVLSAYRTVAYQQKLFDRNVQSRMDDDGMTYEEAYADTAVNIAPAGGSEHNAGLAVDIITENDWDTYTAFEDTEEFAWLQEHAAEYGFIMRYASGKEDITGFIYEPWHYRYVGVKYAADIQASGLCLEEYLESIGYTD